MLALWIVLAVVVVLAVAATVTTAVRRRRPGAPPAGKVAPPAPPPPVTGVPPAPGPPATAPAPGGEPPAPTAPSRATAPPLADQPSAGAPEAPAEATAPPEAPTTPPSFRDRLGKARGLLSGYVGGVRARGRIDPATWDELEEALIRADVGVATTTALLDGLRDQVSAGTVRDPDGLLAALRAQLVAILETPGPTTSQAPGSGTPQAPGLATPQALEPATPRAPGSTTPPGPAPSGEGPVGEEGPTVDDVRALAFDDTPGVTNVWLFVGVNGVGKTTTVGKVARRQRAGGRSVLLAAGDTFRAAAGEQLAQWAERTGAEIVRGAEGGDPSAIVFDAVQRANARGNDLVLADTAGRLHTKVNLVEELKKIRRVADRPPGKVTEVLLVLDATTGQNAVAQARQFGDAVAVTGIVLTKLDGTAKGGVVVAVQRELGVPVKLVGLGEGPDDLVPFQPEEFVEALFS